MGPGVKLIAYADDTVLLVPGDSRVELETVGNAAIEKVIEWGGLTRLTFAEKTSAMMLKGNFDRWRKPVISIDGRRIIYPSVVIYLGIQMEENMKVHTHVLDIIERVKKIFFGLARLITANSGYSCDAMRTLYKGTVESLLTYASEFWGPCAVRSSKLTKALLRVQRTLLIVVNKAYRTISYEANTVIAGIVPIDLLIEERINIHDDMRQGMARVDSRTLRRRETLNKWQERWNRSTKGRETYGYFPSVERRMNMRYSWNHYATQYLSGLGNFNGKLYGFRLKEDPMCPTCNTEETASHVLFDCPVYNEERADLSTLLQDTPDTPREEWKKICVRPTHVKTFVAAATKIGRRKEMEANN